MRTLAVFVENRPFFGALLVHLPLLHALRQRFPDARLVLFAPWADARLLVEAGAADDLVVYAGRFLDVRRRLRAAAADTVFVLRPASRWLDLAVASARPRLSAGFDSWLARRLYSRTAPHDTRIYRPRKYLSVLTGRDEALTAPLESPFRALAAGAGGSPPIRTRTLAVLPGGGAGDFKRWGAERFVALAEALAARDPDLRFLWVLGPQEADVPERVARSAVADRSNVMLDRPLPELSAAAFAVVAAVGNDCGPGHVFQMCGVPFTCVMSDHDGEGAIRVAEWVDAHSWPWAVLSSPHEPIDRIPVERVHERVLAMLSAGEPALPNR